MKSNKPISPLVVAIIALILALIVLRFILRSWSVPVVAAAFFAGLLAFGIQSKRVYDSEKLQDTLDNNYI